MRDNDKAKTRHEIRNKSKHHANRGSKKGEFTNEMNQRILSLFLELGLVTAKTFVLIELKQRHDLRKKYLHEKDFETIYEIRNFKNKTKYDFADDEVRDFEPLGKVEK